jgi:molybdopterin converting factor small subunit
MMLQVRLFASLAETAGCSADAIEVQPSIDVAELWRLLSVRHPSLGEIRYRPLAACDLEYVSWDRRLEGVKEVAFLPPVSGG